jgi:UDP-N-acetylglucosamine--dolichyl-phosphate N-acetylglucosaminephosphotransferase
MKKTGIVGIDIMKKKKKPVADMGGPGVIMGLLFGVFFYISYKVLSPTGLSGLIYILACLCTVLIITLIGFFDSLTSLIDQREGEGEFEQYKKIGIPRWMYYLIPVPAAVPLVAVNAGISKMSLPFIGRVDFGLVYPFVLIPLAILCCSNATNFLAGFNGLEAGMGSVLHLSLGFYAYKQGLYNASLISLCFGFSLLAFLRFNWYPAKIFPGDLNYTIGALYASVTVIGNMEKFAILCFTPYIVEAILKAFSRFEAESYGVLRENNVVKPRDENIRGLTHIVMRLGDFTEPQVTIILIILEFVVCLTSFAVIKYL